MNPKPFSVRGFCAVVPADDKTWQAEIPAHLKRRDPRIWHMAYVAVARLLKEAPERPRSMAVGTALGALDETKSFLDGIFKDGFGSPKNFIASVHNSMAGKLALEFKIDGPNLTLCDGQNSFASALASCVLFPSSAFPCLVVAVDESIPLVNELAPRLSPACAAHLKDGGREAAIALLLDRRVIPESPSIRAIGPVALAGKEPSALGAELAARLDNGSASSISPIENCRSFASAPLQAYGRLLSKQPGRLVIVSYSPSSKACAAVEVRL
ncbi:MAG TPA: beta-ketoacyl synthase chain length factor [Chitinivibrionales bacterium]|nr:beta-ketoacyl synthase chain length factor [Chitinivibrionales bacterium]